MKVLSKSFTHLRNVKNGSQGGYMFAKEKMVPNPSKTPFAQPEIPVYYKANSGESRNNARRTKNFQLLLKAMGDDLALLAVKAHISIDRARRIADQIDAIDDQLSEHMNRMLGIEAGWFEQQREFVETKVVEMIKNHKDEEDEQESESIQNPIKKEDAMIESKQQVEHSTIEASTEKNTVTKQDTYNIFAEWLREKVESRPGLKKQICETMGIEMWMLNGWISARRRMFIDDVTQMQKAVREADQAWGFELMSVYEENVSHRTPTRGRRRSVNAPDAKKHEIEQISTSNTIAKEQNTNPDVLLHDTFTPTQTVQVSAPAPEKTKIEPYATIEAPLLKPSQNKELRPQPPLKQMQNTSNVLTDTETEQDIIRTTQSALKILEILANNITQRRNNL